MKYVLVSLFAIGATWFAMTKANDKAFLKGELKGCRLLSQMTISPLVYTYCYHVGNVLHINFQGPEAGETADFNVVTGEQLE